jgi:hypothetical protein
MGKDILGMYGRDASTPQKPRASGGGVMPVRDVMNYAPPSIPGWNGGMQSPGNHGTNYGPSGFQGPKGCPGGEGGSVGIGGKNKGMGTNRG